MIRTVLIVVNDEQVEGGGLLIGKYVCIRLARKSGDLCGRDGKTVKADPGLSEERSRYLPERLESVLDCSRSFSGGDKYTSDGTGEDDQLVRNK